MTPSEISHMIAASLRGLGQVRLDELSSDLQTYIVERKVLEVRMTEQEWLTSDRPARMVNYVAGKWEDGRRQVSERKLRLFACACCRQVWDLLGEERCRRAVEMAERYGDGGVDCKAMDEAFFGLAPPGEPQPAFALAVVPLNFTLGSEAARAVLANLLLESRGPATRRALAARCADLLREIAGNPVRPVRLPEERTCCGRCGGERCSHDSGECRCDDCGADAWMSSRGWITSQVRSLAQDAYHHRQPDGTLDPLTLAALADALEEAGCAEGDVLRHLRAPVPHVRGCWGVDLILGLN
jgi:hypothetical protein